MCPMTKLEAIALVGGRTASDLARVLGVTRQAIQAWPAVLTQKQSDRVVGAATRLARRQLEAIAEVRD